MKILILFVLCLVQLPSINAPKDLKSSFKVYDVVNEFYTINELKEGKFYVESKYNVKFDDEQHLRQWDKAIYRMLSYDPRYDHIHTLITSHSFHGTELSTGSVLQKRGFELSHISIYRPFY